MKTLYFLLGMFCAQFSFAMEVDSAAYFPPLAPEMKGVLAKNTKLLQAKLLAKGKIVGPEDVDVDSLGRVYGAAEGGKIVRISIDATGKEMVEEFADTGGRPLGLHFDALVT